jgi:hypothetical protein
MKRSRLAPSFSTLSSLLAVDIGDAQVTVEIQEKEPQEQPRQLFLKRKSLE